LAVEYKDRLTVYSERGKQGQAQRTAQRIAAQAHEMGAASAQSNYNDEEGHHWLVSSSKDEGATYKVTGDQETDSNWSCICLGFAMRRSGPFLLARTCKHIQAVRLGAELAPLNKQLQTSSTVPEMEQLPPPPAPLASPRTHLQRSMKRFASELAQMSRSMDEAARRPVEAEQQAAFDTLCPPWQQVKNRYKMFQQGSLSTATLPSRRSANKRFQEQMGSLSGGYFPKRKKVKKKKSVTRVTTAQREDILSQLSQVEPSLDDF